MKKHIGLIFIILFALLFSACGNIDNTPSDESNTSKNPSTSESSKSAVVYFSATGTTKRVAETIAKTTDADIFEILPQDPYSIADLNYNNSECRANKEQNNASSRPLIRNNFESIGNYDIIYLGFPIWWGTNPRIIQTFLESNNLSNAKIYLFCTSGGSGITTSIRDLKNEYPSLNIIDGKRFTNAYQKEIPTWIDSIQK